MPSLRWTCFLVSGFLLLHPAGGAEPLTLDLRYQSETETGSGRFHRLERSESWQPAATAVIVCDMWDSHHCYRAVQRGNELVPRLNQVLAELRDQGVSVIHAPSGCVDFYADHPARKRALAIPAAAAYPPDIGSWCYEIPAEEKATYPLDQSDGGEDDTPEEHARWEAELRAAGRNPDAPWIRQNPAISIDAQQDVISDSGTEIWNLLTARGIENVILTGVHTNMCVLGRPFGLRRLAMAGKNVVLMRDLTDTMYNPASAPYVSHFTGTDLIIDHIERHVCPTITSDQVVGGEPFRFANDRRPRLAIVIGEREYQTASSLPRFALDQLGKDYCVRYIFASEEDHHAFPGIEMLAEADMALISVRRRTPPDSQLAVVRQFVAAGKPMLGIRTASHAFPLRQQSPPQGHAAWPAFDAEVWGGNYTNHHGNQQASRIRAEPSAADHPLLAGVEPLPFPQGGSLYITSPLDQRAQPLLWGGLIEDTKQAEPPGPRAEPVAWTFPRADGGVSFYTSLGHPDDFAGTAFPRLLKNAVGWAATHTDGAAAPDAETAAAPAAETSAGGS